ncbi:MAG: hypothetical protein CMD04_04615 [Flavobacteriales bacterium]|nr:hypothetical protein [Flavobacteriales bacterium]
MELNRKIILPIAYWGSIVYQGVLIQNNCIIDIYENFKKQSIHSRCEILGPNKIIKLNVPKVRKSSSKTSIKNLSINYDHNWQKVHWKSLTSCYRSSPYFEYYEEELEKLYQNKIQGLLEWNILIQKKFFELIDVKKKLEFTNKFQKNYIEKDYRDQNFRTNNVPKYTQVFGKEFHKNLSILDLLFNLGPDTKKYLENLSLN